MGDYRDQFNFIYLEHSRQKSVSGVYFCHMAYLVLVRHGESEWNAKGLWTGWTDIGLSDKGREEAKKAGGALKDITFDAAFVSKLKRAKETLEEMESVWGHKIIPLYEDQALNERDYGDLTGKNKWAIKEEYGEEQFLQWRRGWDFPVPGGETLKDVYSRVVPFYQEKVLPEVQDGKNVLISAHGNSLRALVKYLETISDKDISGLEIATGEVYLYQLDNKGKIVKKEIRTTA